MSQLDYFLKIDGVPGESTDEKGKDQIEILSFSFGMENQNAGSRSTGGAASGGRVLHREFKFTKLIDKASVKLMEKACDGTHIKWAELTGFRATGQKQKYFFVKMTDILISDYKAMQLNATERSAGRDSGAGLNLPMEEVSFNYGDIEWTYTHHDHGSGQAKGDVKYGWSLLLNKKK